jgi:hypothetical protein
MIQFTFKPRPEATPTRKALLQRGEIVRALRGERVPHAVRLSKVIRCDHARAGRRAAYHGGGADNRRPIRGPFS